MIPEYQNVGLFLVLYWWLLLYQIYFITSTIQMSNFTFNKTKTKNTIRIAFNTQGRQFPIRERTFNNVNVIPSQWNGFFLASFHITDYFWRAPRRYQKNKIKQYNWLPPLAYRYNRPSKTFFTLYLSTSVPRTFDTITITPKHLCTKVHKSTDTALHELNV